MNEIDNNKAMERWRPILEKLGCSDEKQIEFLAIFAERFGTAPVNTDFNINDVQHMILPKALKYLSTTNLHNLNYSFNDKIENVEKIYEGKISHIEEMMDKLNPDKVHDKDVLLLNYLFESVNEILDKKFDGITAIEIQNVFLNFVTDNEFLKVYLYCKVSKNRNTEQMMKLIKQNLDSDNSIDLTSPLLDDGAENNSLIIYEKDSNGAFVKRFNLKIEEFNSSDEVDSFDVDTKSNSLRAKMVKDVIENYSKGITLNNMDWSELKKGLVAELGRHLNFETQVDLLASNTHVTGNVSFYDENDVIRDVCFNIVVYMNLDVLD